MFSTYAYPPNVGINPSPLPDSNLGPVNQVDLGGIDSLGKAQGEYINGSFDDKEHAPDMGPATYPISVFMNSGKRRIYYKGTLMRFSRSTMTRSRMMELSSGPRAFANCAVPGEQMADVTFVAPLSESQELIPKKTQFVSAAVGGVSDIIVSEDSPSFTVFPGDTIRAEATETDVILSPTDGDIDLGISTHYHEHKQGSKNSILRISIK